MEPEIPAWLIRPTDDEITAADRSAAPRPSFRECLGNCVANLRQYPRLRAGLWSGLAVVLGAAVTVSALHMLRPAPVARVKDETIVVKTVQTVPVRVAAVEPAVPVAEPPPFVPPVVNPPAEPPPAPTLTKAERKAAERAIKQERAELLRAERVELRKRKRKAWARRVVQEQKYRDEWRN